MKKSQILLISFAIAIAMLLPSCDVVEQDPSQETAKEVIDNSKLVWGFPDATTMSTWTEITMIGIPLKPYDEREQLAYKKGENTYNYYTVAEVEVIEVFKNDSGTKVEKGDIIEIIEYCGYVESNGKTLFLRYSPLAFPLTEGHPHAFFLEKWQNMTPEHPEVYLQGWMGSFDLTNRTPTDREIRYLSNHGSEVMKEDENGKEYTYNDVYKEFKESVFDVPLMKDSTEKYLE